MVDILEVVGHFQKYHHRHQFHLHHMIVDVIVDGYSMRMWILFAFVSTNHQLKSQKPQREYNCFMLHRYLKIVHCIVEFDPH